MDRGNRLAGIIFVILSMVHGPLPQPDFHKIRHQDGVGQVCEHHDHLLRWHPGAGIASDVAVLHWHWFLPTTESEVFGISSDRPAIHAHTPGWDATTVDAPQISADTSVRLDLRIASAPLATPFHDGASADFARRLASIRWFLEPLGAPPSRGISIQTLLNRWVC